MRKGIIGIMAALAVVLGFAAPASATPVAPAALVDVGDFIDISNVVVGNVLDEQAGPPACLQIPATAVRATVTLFLVQYLDSACTIPIGVVVGLGPVIGGRYYIAN